MDTSHPAIHFSIGLVYATAMAQAQMGLLKSRACRYENTIELNGKSPFYKELKNINGIESISLSMSSVLNAWMHELPMQQPDGSVKHYYTIQIPTDTAFLSTMHIHQLAGVSPAKAYQEYSHPVFINESYARILNIDASKIGHNLREFDTFSDSLSILAGIIENFPFNSLKEEIAGQKISFAPESSLTRAGMFIQARLHPETRHETLAQIKELWEKMYDGREFQYTDMHQQFMQRNKIITTLSKILISYSLIAMVLTCFGLFGISWYAVRHRTREIAIRKVHGALNRQIVWALNRSFLWQILIAYTIAIPLVWWLMEHWLAQFAYRASATWWNFVLPLALVLVVTGITVTIHSYRAARSNPTESLKTE